MYVKYLEVFAEQFLVALVWPEIRLKLISHCDHYTFVASAAYKECVPDLITAVFTHFLVQVLPPEREAHLLRQAVGAV